MGIPIIAVSMSKNTVTTGEQFKIAVSILQHDYLSLYRHSELKPYTHLQLEEGSGISGR